MADDDYSAPSLFLTPVPHDPFSAPIPPNVQDYINSRPSSEEWEPTKKGWDIPDQYNAANPPGPRQDPPDLSVLYGLRSHQSFDENAAPDLQNEFARKLYEKGAIGEWKDMNEEMMLTPDESNKLFPIIPSLPIDKAGYTLTPVPHNPFDPA